MTLHIALPSRTPFSTNSSQKSATSGFSGDSMRFRRNMERIGEITAYEISKAFSYKPCVGRDAAG